MGTGQRTCRQHREDDSGKRRDQLYRGHAHQHRPPGSQPARGTRDTPHRGETHRCAARRQIPQDGDDRLYLRR